MFPRLGSITSIIDRPRTAMATPDDGDEKLQRLRRQLDREDVRDAARALLEPGEVLRELGEVGVAYGDTGPGSDAQPVEPASPGWFDRFWAFATRTTLRKIVFYTLLAPLMVYLAVDSVGSSALLDRMIGGRTCMGPRGSLARRTQHALSVLGPGANHVVVSDRRILLVRAKLFAEPPELTMVSALGLGEIAAARHRPRGPLRRRVELCFTDGSRIVVALPSFRSPSPRRFLAALSPRTT
jgi:hypothetical protein